MLKSLQSYCANQGCPLSAEQIAEFVAYESDLYATNEVMNLTRVPRGECETRHFIDSLLITSLLPHSASVVDIGTGPGFPGWPLAVARPDLEVTAIDSSGKMLGLLRRHPRANLTIKQLRAEEAGIREAYDVATGRALAPLSAQLELSAPMLKVGGLALPFRSVAERESLSQFPADVLGLRLVRIEERQLPGTDIIRLFPIFEKVSPTPDMYPRSWSQIRTKPIWASAD
jgi:16S rRNA (guanine527-N7)-methyltransferase